MKLELLQILQETIKAIDGFNEVDIYERYAYEVSDFPICVIKDSQDNIEQASSGCWKVQSQISIDIFTSSIDDAIVLSNKVLGAIHTLPNDEFIYEVNEVTRESEYSDSLLLKSTISLQVSYFNEGWNL